MMKYGRRLSLVELGIFVVAGILGRKAKVIFRLIVFAIFLISCTPSESVIESAIFQTQTALPPVPTQTAYPTYTPWPTYTPLPTYTPAPTIEIWVTRVVIVTPTKTPGPSATPTVTPTPTKTPTPTATPTPFSVARCRDLIINLTETTTDDQIDAQFAGYHGQCVRVVYDPKYGDMATTNFMLYLNKLKVQTDKDTPPDVVAPKQYSSVWGVLLVAGQPPENTRNDTLLLRRVDTLPVNQAPLHLSGLYRVGKESEIAPGSWKSALLPTATDSCYWERTNPVTGAIIANHFGIGGMAVRVFEGEVFQTNPECLPWYYVGP